MAVNDQLLESLLQDIALVTFRKRTTGELRTMPCTKNLKYVPESMMPKGTDRQLNPDIVKVFSLDRNSWRSFHRQDVIEVKKVNYNGEANDSGQSGS